MIGVPFIFLKKSYHRLFEIAHVTNILICASQSEAVHAASLTETDLGTRARTGFGLYGHLTDIIGLIDFVAGRSTSISFNLNTISISDVTQLR